MAKNLSNVGRFAFGALLEPRPNSFGAMEWALGFVISEDAAMPMFDVIESALQQKRAEQPRFPKTNDGLRMPFRVSEKKMEDGTKQVVPGEYLFKFSRKLERKMKTGETSRNTPPAIYDSLGRVINGKINRIGGGTTGKVVYDVFVYDSPAAKGVAFQLVGFQIAELKTSELELPPIEGGFVAEQTEDDDIAAVLAGNA